VKKLTFFILVLLFPTLLLAQSTITVVSNIKVTYDQKRGSYRWYRPVFAHEGSTLAADSSDFNEGDNFFDAYGHVVITQPNGTVVYADKLHYTEENQQALLTGNVRLVDQASTLTTDYLTYNMKSKRGTYHGGGRIINGTDTLDSKNGFYFENSQDAYFRHDVVVRTPDVLIKTDTMRYNSGTKMTYFYGPTNIFGKNGTLYTENGDYNTQSDRARFGKNNLYTEGSKFLQGDSLYYDGVSGNGRAVKNVVFVDTAQQIVMRGQLGTYNKATQTTVVTQNAYIVLAAEDSKSDSSNVKADSLSSPSLTTADSIAVKPISEKTETQRDSTFMTADTLFSQVIPLRDYIYLKLKLGQENDDLEEDYDEPEADEPNQIISQVLSNDTASLTIDSLSADSLSTDSIQTSIPDSLKSDSLTVKTDSLQLSTDSLKTDPTKSEKPELSRKEKRELKKQEKQKAKEAKAAIKKAKQEEKEAEDKKEELEKGDSKSPLADSLLNKPPIVLVDSLIMDSLRADSFALDSSITPIKKGAGDSLLNEATKTALQAKTDTLNTDTGETRIVRAYHNVKIFKSDLQAVADSAYYGYADSVIRCYGRPIIWSQGSQLSADTVYMILKNQKMENILFDKNAFIVNTQLDSSKFNQVKGRKITGYFKNNNLDRVYVDGNAESIYYTVEENEFTGMIRSISSRIKIKFQENEMTDVISIRKLESTYHPITSIPPDTDILEGFIWKPELRPKSKEEIIPTGKPDVPEKKAVPASSPPVPADSSAEKEKDTLPGNSIPGTDNSDTDKQDSALKTERTPENLSDSVSQKPTTLEPATLRKDSLIKRDSLIQDSLNTKLKVN